MRKTFKKRNDLMIKACIVVIFLLTLFLLIKMRIALESELDTYEIETYLTDNLKIYFAPFKENIIEAIKFINSAQEEIHCVFRAFNFPELEEALKQREEEGLKVRLYVDSDYMGNKRIYLPYTKFSNPKDYAMMHSNYCVIDDKAVMAGSIIFNQNTLEKNLHDFVIIESVELAGLYNSDFWKMYNNQTITKSDKVPEFIKIREDLFVKSCFSPYEDCESVIIDAINQTEESILFAVYSFTNTKIFESLKRAEERGIIIQGVIEASGVTDDTVDYQSLNSVRIKMDKLRVHTKLFIFDNDIVITGSLNPTFKGVNYNNENILIIKNEEISAVYKNFNYHMYENAQDNYFQYMKLYFE